jgi:hypothetical protein
MSSLKQSYPLLFAKLEDESIEELRELIVIDENYADIDDEEVDVFDPSDYNYLVYITEAVSAVLGEEGLKKLYMKLDNNIFDDFLASEEDLYGVKSQQNADEVANTILLIVEEILKEEK